MNQTLIVLMFCVTAMVTYSYGSFRERININYVNDKKYSPSFQYAPSVKESKRFHVYQQLLAARESLTAKLHATPSLDIIKHYVNHQTNKGVKPRNNDLTFINGKVRIPTRPRSTVPEESAVYIDLLNSTQGNKQRRRSARSHNNTNVRNMTIPLTNHLTKDNNTSDNNPYLLILPLRTLNPSSKPNTAILDSMKRSSNNNSRNAKNNSNSSVFEQNDNTSFNHLQMRNLNKYIHEKLINHLVRNKKHLPTHNYLRTRKHNFNVNQMRNMINHRLSNQIKSKSNQILSAAQVFKSDLLYANPKNTLELKSVNKIQSNHHKTVSKSRVDQRMANDLRKKSYTETNNKANFINIHENNHCTNTFNVNAYDHTNKMEQENILMKNYATNKFSENLHKKLPRPKKDNLYYYQSYVLNNDRKKTKEVDRSFNDLAPNNNLLVQSERHLNNDILFQEGYDVNESSSESAQSQIKKHNDESYLSFNDIVTRFRHTKQKKRTINRSDEPHFEVDSPGSDNLQQNDNQNNANCNQSKQTKLNVNISNNQTDNNNSNEKLSVILDYVTVMLKRNILNRRLNSRLDRQNRLRGQTSRGDHPVNYNLYNDQRITYITAKDSDSADSDVNVLFRPFKRKAKITGLMYNVVSNNDQDMVSTDENNLNLIDIDDSDMSMLNLLLKALV